ncbi:MAG: glycosyltransferase, partial [Planctomycetales bacterium]|nr:glycosyltransferase [Planctomycetales bacterium]
QRTGLLYEPENIDEMEAACRLLLSNANLRERIGRDAAEHIRENYTWRKNAERVVELAGELQRNAKECTQC